MDGFRPTLVTGASGLLGANLVLALRDRGRAVVAVSRRWRLRGEGIEAHSIDLNDPSAASELVRRVRPNWVFHCAALTDLDRCEAYPDEARQANAEMPRVLAEAAGRVGARFAYVSSDAVFDGGRGEYDEGDAPAPLNQYARSKLMGENAVREVLPESLVVRVNIFGWNAQPKSSLAEWMLGRLERGDAFPGFQDVVFNPLLVNDLSDLLIRMTGASLSGLYHVGSAERSSKYEFGRALAGVFGLDEGLVQPSTLTEMTPRTPRPRVTTLRTDRACASLGTPMPSLVDGLRRFRRLREEGTLARLRFLVGRGTDGAD